MMSFVRRRITYANTAVTVALVFAMAGGAFAAGAGKASKHKYVVTSISQVAPGVRHALKGARGPAGEKGAAGAQGPAGVAGEKGAQGTPGKDGETPSMEEFTGTLGTCSEGGTEFTLKGKEAFVCNGKEGKEGKAGTEGQPWTPNNTLPSGATETGAWADHPTVAGEGRNWVPLSFFIPLANPLPSTNVLYIDEEENEKAEVAIAKGEPNPLPEECPGVATAPKAKPGFLCVYAKQETFIAGPKPENITIVGAASGPGASTAGALIRYEVSEVKGFQFMFGTYAVTAP